MKLTKISLYDWAGVYDESGKLITEGHSVRWDEVIKYLGHSIEFHDLELDTLDEFGNCLPPRLNDLLDYINKK